MPRLYGRDWSRLELQEHVSNIDQLAYIRPAVLRGGRAEGVEVMDVATGSGFQFTVVPGRALDISHASYRGVPLCWRSYTGEVAAPYFEPEGMGWLRGAFGGLMATGGLSYMGSPSVDKGEALGIHGRVSYLPASRVGADAAWDGDTYRMWVHGKVEEATSLGSNLVLTRDITTEMGANSFVIRDTVENCSYERAEHMMLYHFNLGFPLLSDKTRLLVQSLEVTPRDDDSAAGLDSWNRFDYPLPQRPHQLFYHRVRPDSGGKAHVVLDARQDLGDGPLAVYLSYSYASLPWLINWKCLQSGNYVTGIEPANAWVQGRNVEREMNRLRFLEPWERVSYEVEFGVLVGEEEIRSFTERHELPAS